MKQARTFDHSYYYSLDCLRFFSAIIVAAFHLTWHIDGIKTTVHFGWIGVQIFFVISGFVIANSAYNNSPFRFLKSRFLRLYPAAIICAILSFVSITYNAGGADTELLNQLVSSVVLFAKGPFLTTSYWTLPIEIAFYGLIFIVLIYSDFNSIKKIMSVLTVLSATYCTLLVLDVFQLLNLPFLDFGYGLKNASLMRHGVYFAIGIYLWSAINGEFLRSDIKYFVIALVAAAFEIACRSFEISTIINSPELDLSTSFLQSTGLFYLACIFLYFSTKFSNKFELGVMKYKGLLRMAGLTTYPLYLLHESIGNQCRDFFVDKFSTSYLLAVMLAIIIVVVLSAVVATSMEPVLRKFFAKLFKLNFSVYLYNRFLVRFDKSSN